MIYSRLFEWLIGKINAAAKLEEDDGGAASHMRSLALLDIFGLEVLDVNSLEQLLINYANERLQQFYVQSSFEREKEVYLQEGIDVSVIEFKDNNDVIALIDHVATAGSRDPAKPGIFELLSDVCRLSEATDANFIQKLKETGHSPELFQMGKGPKEKPDLFTIMHTAASVPYLATKFREKNMESLEPKIIEVLADNTDVVMTEMFPKDERTEKQSRFLAGYLKDSINKLLDVLMKTAPYFIRCVKPNDTKMPNNFNNKVTLQQLKSLSIMDALKLAQNGYPHRMKYETFLEDYQLIKTVYNPGGEDAQGMVRDLLQKVGIPTVGYQMGETLVFLKKDQFRLLGEQNDKINKACTDVGEDIVRISRKKRACEDFDDAQTRLIKIQSYARGFRERFQISKMQRRKRYLWGAALFALRYRRFRRDRLAAFTIQTTIRELKAMALLHSRIQEKRLRTSRNMVKTYVQVILAQRALQTSIEDAHRRKMKRTVQKATDLWAKREALKRFWIYRGLMMPAKREIHRRKLLLAKLQACIRGGLLRGQIRQHGKPQVPANPLVRKVMMQVEQVKQKYEVKGNSTVLQRQMKGYLMLRRFIDMR